MRFSTLAFLAVMLLQPGLARAQSAGEKSAARSAAKAGITAFQEERFQEAVDLLTRAESVIHAPTHLLFLARSQLKLGKWVAAREAYLQLINENLSATAPEAFHSAQNDAKQELAELEPRMPQLTIRVSGAPRETVKVTIDGDQLPNVALGVPTPASPGEIVVVASAPGMADTTVRVQLTEGKSDAVDLTLTPVVLGEAEADTIAPKEQTATPKEEPSGSARKTWGYVLGGAGLAGIGVGSVFGALTLSTSKSAQEDSTLCPEYQCTPAGNDEVKDARTQALVATLGIGIGAALVGVGTYLLLSSPQVETAQALRWEPEVGPGVAVLRVRGAF